MKFRILTRAWEITIEGTHRQGIWENRAVSEPPALQASISGSDEIIEILTDGEVKEIAAPTYQGAGPQLFEETDYRLSVVNRYGNDARLTHLDPSLIQNVRPISSNLPILSGNINFRSQVGDSKFIIDDGECSIELILEVRPSKLDYRTDYEELLEDVSGLARQLVLEFLRATTRGAGVGDDSQTRQIEWLLLLRKEIAGLKQALNFITANPHRQLTQDSQFSAVEKIRRPSTETRRAVVRGKGEGQWSISPHIGRHRYRLPTASVSDSLDGPENRWLRNQIQRAVNSLAILRQEYSTSQLRFQGSKANLRSKAISEELARMEGDLSPFLLRSPFAEATSPVSPSFTSLTLQGKPGYREAYQALLRLNMSLIVGGDALEIPLTDLSELYEMWCFLAVIRSASQQIGGTIDLFDLVELRDTGIRLTIIPGKKSSIRVVGDSCVAKITYNQSFHMSSGTQRPDIVIELLRKDVPPVLLLLDAKYRIKTDREYVHTFGSPGPPAEALGQLHRYRDAITVKYPKYGRGRPVVRAVALFPLSVEDSSTWTSHPFFRSIEEVGIGALPFLPSNNSWVGRWIEDGMHASPQRLAWPGPDFIAWSLVGRENGVE